MAMTWYEWSASDHPDAREYRSRLAHDDTGNPKNTMIAARMVYDAGVRASLQLAAERLTKVSQPD